MGVALRRPCLGSSIHPPNHTLVRGGPRCSECTAQRERERAARRGTTTERGLGYEHQKVTAQTLAEEKLCWRCGRPGRPGDPLTGGHVVARARGGRAIRQNYHAEHQSCNSRHGGQM